MTKPAGNAKLQRWVDLLAALLGRNAPATFEELARDVPEYCLKLDVARRVSDAKKRKTATESVKRTFERDKDELRTFGVPIESVPDEDGNDGGAYRLRRGDFYLPYLLTTAKGATGRTTTTSPKRVAKYGYQALTSLTFDADELQAVVEAGQCAQTLGDPLLAAEAASALRKLAVDLPVDIGNPAPDAPRVVLPRTRADAETFAVLGDALARKKVATFTYHAMSSDRTERREVEPYGLFFLSGHWYLAARDRGRVGEGDTSALRNFRLDRITDAAVNASKPQTADYAVPASFRLREHARSRQAWELGDGEAVRAVVEFRGTSGPATAARRLGAAVEGREDRRAFEVRRVDAFVRWMLSFAGEVVPVEPPEIVDAFRAELGRIAALYDGSGVQGLGSVVPGFGATTRAPREAAGSSSRESSDGSAVLAREARTTAWEPVGAAAQLRRILQVMPQIADEDEHDLTRVAEQVGTSVDTLRRDLFALVTRYDVPAGFVGGVELYVESDRVSSVSSHLLRPMRLTASELKALELGLAVVRGLRPPSAHAAIERARERLASVIARLKGDPLPGMEVDGWLADPGAAENLAVVRAALRSSRVLRLRYRKSGAGEATERVVRPYGLVAARGMVYLVACCGTESAEGVANVRQADGLAASGGGDGAEAEAIRVFRMDRVEAASVLERRFVRRPGVSVDSVVREGRVFVSGSDEALERMVVWYAPRVARWIAEREGVSVADDGSVTVEYPLADREWGVRQVMQYGGDAVVVGPEGMRQALSERTEELGRRFDRNPRLAVGETV